MDKPQQASSELELNVPECVAISSVSDVPTTSSGLFVPRTGKIHNSNLSENELELSDFNRGYFFKPDPFSFDVLPNHDDHFENSHADYSQPGQTGGISDNAEFVEKPKVKHSVSALFRYAESRDLLLMTAGAVLALLHGATVPMSLLIYAHILNGMIAHSACWDSMKVHFRNSTDKADLRTIPWYLQSGMGLFETVGFDCGYLALIGLGIFIFGILHSSVWTVAIERQIKRIRTELFKAMLSKDAAWFDIHDSDTLKNMIFKMVRQIQVGTVKVTFTISRISTTIAGFCVAFSSDWLVAAALCTLVPVLLVISCSLLRLVSKYSGKQHATYKKAGLIASEAISNWRTIVSFNKQEAEVKRYSHNLDLPLKMGTLRSVLSGAVQGIIFLFIYSTVGLAFWWGSSSQVFHEGGTILLIIICVLMGTMSLGNALPNFEETAIALKRLGDVFGIIDETSAIDNFDDTGTWVESLRGDICLDQVSFHYPSKPERQILQSFSLYVPRGKTVALVGPNGCGKTTVVQLLLRYYDVDCGKLTVDDVDIRELNVRWFRQKIGLVHQNPVLFNATIRDNIRMGAVDLAFVSDDEVVKACRLSNAHDFITRLPLGYDTMVGENGAQLSIGQKQRIAIARALVSNPKILVLDEATSALDINSEAIVQQALDKARIGRTTLIIPHRLSTVRNADLIAVMDNGHIAEMGTHDNLMEYEGLYYSMVNCQHEPGEESPLNGSELDLTNDMHYINEEEGMITRKGSESLLANTLIGGVRPELTRINSHNSSCSRGKVKSSENSRRPSLGLIAIERGDLVPRLGSKSTKEATTFEIISFICRWSRPEIPIIVICAVVSIFSGGVQFSYGLVFSEFLSSLCPNGNYDHFMLLIGILVILGVVKLALLTLQYFLFAVIGENLTKRVRCLLFGKILRMDATWFDREENSPSMLTEILLKDCARIQGLSGIRLGLVLSAVGLMGAVIVHSFILDWRIALPMVTVMPMIILAGYIFNRLGKISSSLDDDDDTEISAIAVDALSNIRTVVALAAGPYFLEHFCDRYLAIQNRTIKFRIRTAILYSFSMASILWTGAIAFSIGSYLMDRDMTEFWRIIRIYVLITFTVLPYYGFSVVRISSLIPWEEDALRSVSKIIRILSEENTIDVDDPLACESLAARQLVEENLFERNKCSGQIEFKDVSFSYPNRAGVPVLSRINFTAERGQCVALCGPSGGGKSTIMHLIQRLYDPKSGSISIDGIDVRSANVRWVRGNIGVVEQHPVLFTMTIGQNVAFGSRCDETPSDSEIEHACKLANANEFIDCFPDHLNTEVGEGGAQLSGGQKQRIAVARALIRNPPILLLDEATSSLDAASERMVQEALEAAEEGRTSIVITHRLSMIEKAHKIIVVEQGQVSEQGTHSELMRLRGTYYKLYQLQSCK